MTSFSGVTFVLFCFVFVFMLSLKPLPFVQSSFDMHTRALSLRHDNLVSGYECGRVFPAGVGPGSP